MLVHQHVRGGGRECNQHILHHTAYIETCELMPVAAGEAGGLEPRRNFHICINIFHGKNVVI